MKTSRNITLELGSVDFFKIELWLQRKTPSLPKPCNISKEMPGFSIKWRTKQGNSTGKNEMFPVKQVLEKMYDNKNKPIIKIISTYQNFVSKNLRYRIVRSARRFNMTDDEIWDIVRGWKLEAMQKKVFSCASDVMSSDYFPQLFSGLAERIKSDRPTIDHTETKNDLLLAFDIFSFLTFCQNDAIELQIFFESLFSTSSSETILQATMNTLKMKSEHKGIEAALLRISEELETMMALEHDQILQAMYDSSIGASSMSPNQVARGKDQGQKGLFSWNMTSNVEMKSAFSNHPVSISDKKSLISPSALVPFCSFGTQMIGLDVLNMSFPICNIFEPTAYKDRLCYQVDIMRNHPQQKVLEGKENGLMLLIDVNAERSIKIESQDKYKTDESKNSKKSVFLGQSQTISKKLANIHIGTLAKYTGHGPGDYILTSVKEMTGTENFLAWPEEKRGCALEKYERCQMNRFLEKSMQCSCSPFQLMPAATDQSEKVRNTFPLKTQCKM